MYEYRAEIIHVVDGDTVDAIVDLGCGVLKKQRLRLHGIDAPEKQKETLEAGKESQRHLEQLILEHGPSFVIRTFRDDTDKYGRYLAEIYTDDENLPFPCSINAIMVRDGHAIYRTY